MTGPQETWVDRWLFVIFRRKTAEEQHLAEVKAQVLVAEQASRVIQDHEYIRHMALVQLEGMEDWRHGRNIRKEIPR